jgi:two-component system, NarL family, sensor kinase
MSRSTFGNDPLQASDRTPAGDRPAWRTLADASKHTPAEFAPVSRRQVLTSIILGAVAVLILVAVSGSLAARRLAEKESVNDAAKNAGLLAETVIQPALRNSLVSGDPESSAFKIMDKAVKRHVVNPETGTSVRVKIWTPKGKIVYSDERRLVGLTYPLGDEERDVFTHPVTRAEVSDLSRKENKYERGQGRLLEVYRPVWMPNGQPLLFETYAPYDGVKARSTQLWRGFAGITVSSLLAVIVLMVPIVWRLLGRVRQSQIQREALLERAVEASTDERRRIAGTLHDGVVQELAGASFVVSSAAARASAIGQEELAAHLRDAAATVRRGITGMRTLLVDIYPPSLETSGLVVALEDLTSSLEARDIDVVLHLDPDSVEGLDPESERLIYRVAHESLLNAMRHALASRVSVSLRAEENTTVLEVADNGIGFDAAEAFDKPHEGHFGLRVLVDVAREGGADLLLATAPGHGTRWQLRVRHGGHHR